MKTSVPQKVLEAFTGYTPGLPEHASGEMIAEPLSGGLINHTFKVSRQLKPLFLVQQLNKNVFNNPKDVQNNYVHIYQYADLASTGLRMPYPVSLDQRKYLYEDEKGNYWRAFEFINDARMLNVAEKPQQAKATAKAFAKFTAAFEGFNTDLLKEVIPDFHNLAMRYEQFETALKGEMYERMGAALPVINELKAREHYRHFYDSIIASDKFPRRVMHHDAKIANVLFSNKTGRVICLVDYDTVMPGYFFSDLGDMIRSMATGEDENSTAFEKLTIREDFYESIVSGYLEVMGKQLTDSEKKYIHYAGLLMINMQALRFAADYLNGDIYYRTEYPEHNLDRAKNQLALLKNLEDFLREKHQFRS